ncbi:MAG: GerMN domain-containing protein [Defluviitaleaceae bacterium]|nr:GerMN domain-containing protein [Defluviitaleaceae bacterium]
MYKLLGFLRNLTRVQVGSVVLVAVLVVVATLVLANSDWDFSGEDEQAIYFFNVGEGRLEPEFRFLPYPLPGGTLSMVDMALVNMINEPDRTALSRVWPEDIELRELITGLEMQGNTLVVTFSEAYRKMGALEEALFRSAFTLTMVGLPHIEEVKIRVAYGNEDGEIGWDEWFESAGTIANDPSISPMRISNATFGLFFVDEAGEGLVVETYFAEGVNVRQRALASLERLIEGPSDPDFLPAVSIPTGTRVRNVIEVAAGGDIYVDLSAEFNRFGGTAAQAELLIASIVNTLIESIIPGGGRARRVFFFIDSIRYEEFHGVSDFHLYFTFDETLVLGYGEDEYEYEDE